MKGSQLLVRGVAVLLLSGCAHANRSPDYTGRQPVRNAVVQKDILPNPRLFKSEYCFPRDSTHQLFSWGYFGQEWTLKVQDPKIDYAGIYLRKPLTLAYMINDTLLHFTLWPAGAGEELSIVLIEKGTLAQAQQIVSLADYRTSQTPTGWASYNIPLSEFATVTDQEFSQREKFNWNAVEQIRIRRTAPSLSHKVIKIRNLRLRSTALHLL